MEIAIKLNRFSTVILDLKQRLSSLLVPSTFLEEAIENSINTAEFFTLDYEALTRSFYLSFYQRVSPRLNELRDNILRDLINPNPFFWQELIQEEEENVVNADIADFNAIIANEELEEVIQNEAAVNENEVAAHENEVAANENEAVIVRNRNPYYRDWPVEIQLALRQIYQDLRPLQVISLQGSPQTAPVIGVRGIVANCEEVATRFHARYPNFLPFNINHHTIRSLAKRWGW
jgi:hypothetical protein